jgi:hypothetical protein
VTVLQVMADIDVKGKDWNGQLKLGSPQFLGELAAAAAVGARSSSSGSSSSEEQQQQKQHQEEQQ